MTDDRLFATHARIQHAAFEAAYMDLPHPDPASRGFAALVFSYVERLWAEHRAGQGDKVQGDLVADQKPVAADSHARDCLKSWPVATQRWEQPS